MQELDGCKEKDYEYLDELTPAGWAFEFLRRNSDYRDDFNEQLDVQAVLTAAYGPIHAAQKEWRRNPRAWVCKPPVEDGETLERWRRRAALGESEPEQFWFEDWYLKKWALIDRLPDPSAPADPPPRFNTTGSFPLFPDYEKIRRFYNGDDPVDSVGPYQQLPGYAVAVFDLTLPLDGQFDSAASVITQCAKRQENDGSISRLNIYTPPQVCKLFRRYLRALDMAEAGYKPSEIGEVLMPYKDNTAATNYNATKSASGTLTQARQYVEWKYRVIPLLNITSN